MTEPVTAAEARREAKRCEALGEDTDTDEEFAYTLRSYADMLEREERVKVIREAIRIEVATCKDGLVSVDEATDRILSAIEAERPAIEAAERERLRNVAAAECVRHLELNDIESSTMWAHREDWVRSEGETK